MPKLLNRREERLAAANMRMRDRIATLEAENARLIEVNHSVAVCAEHTTDMVNSEGLENGCIFCEAEKLEAEAMAALAENAELREFNQTLIDANEAYIVERDQRDRWARAWKRAAKFWVRSFDLTTTEECIRLKDEIRKRDAELTTVVGIIQRLQPAGSPCPGGPEALARWIVDEAQRENAELKADLQQSRLAFSGALMEMPIKCEHCDDTGVVEVQYDSGTDAPPHLQDEPCPSCERGELTALRRVRDAAKEVVDWHVEVETERIRAVNLDVEETLPAWLPNCVYGLRKALNELEAPDAE